MQTQVFVKGRCIGKRAVPYALVSSEGDDGDPHKEKMLREQHRQVLDAIREGKLDSLLDKRENPETLSGIKELEMEWLNSNSVHAGGNLLMHLRVTRRRRRCRRRPADISFRAPRGCSPTMPRFSPMPAATPK